MIVTPEVFLVGKTMIDHQGLIAYLCYRFGDAGKDIYAEMVEALTGGMAEAEMLCSIMAKLCYKSLRLGDNANLTRVREYTANFESILATAHGAVIEHSSVNLIFTDVSRVLTHELARHRVGIALSQTSGRYCATERLDIVAGPHLAEVQDLIEEGCEELEELTYLMECKLGLREQSDTQANEGIELSDWVDDRQRLRELKVHGDFHTEMEAITARLSVSKWPYTTTGNFDKKKALTSAIRRMLPNGQANEIGVSMNLRTVRHVIALRTGAGAEWEIRYAMHKAYLLCKQAFPLLFKDATETPGPDDIPVISFPRLQPYDKVV